MTEETNNVSETQESVPSAPSPKPVPPDPPKVVKEAEHKLKEMSRKAKERKTAHNASKTRGLSEVNYFWLVIGGLGALGVGYLVFGNKEQTPKPRQRFKGHRPVAYVPPPGPELRSELREKTPVKEPVVEKEDVSVPKFELNCF